VMAMCHQGVVLAAMFLKPTKSGGHTYLQLVESYRNESGQPRQRTRVRQFRVEFLGKHLVFSGLGGLRFDFVMARLGNPTLTRPGYSG
jgi:hypothetical protein